MIQTLSLLDAYLDSVLTKTTSFFILQVLSVIRWFSVRFLGHRRVSMTQSWFPGLSPVAQKPEMVSAVFIGAPYDCELSLNTLDNLVFPLHREASGVFGGRTIVASMSSCTETGVGQCGFH